MWIRFVADYDHRVTEASTVAYLAGDTYNVPSAAGNAAIARGKAVRLRKGARNEEPTEWPSDPVPEASMPE